MFAESAVITKTGDPSLDGSDTTNASPLKCTPPVISNLVAKEDYDSSATVSVRAPRTRKELIRRRFLGFNSLYFFRWRRKPPTKVLALAPRMKILYPRLQKRATTAVLDRTRSSRVA